MKTRGKVREIYDLVGLDAFMFTLAIWYGVRLKFADFCWWVNFWAFPMSSLELYRDETTRPYLSQQPYGTCKTKDLVPLVLSYYGTCGIGGISFYISVMVLSYDRTIGTMSSQYVFKQIIFMKIRSRCLISKKNSF